MTIDFIAYSELDKAERDKINYLKIKRLVLEIEKSSGLRTVFDDSNVDSALFFALRYYDIETEIKKCFYRPYGNIILTAPAYKRDFVLSVTNLLCSMYEQDRGFFQTFVSFVLNEGKDYYNQVDVNKINSYLSALGYTIDGNILKTTSGIPQIETKISTLIEEKLKKINPKLNEARKGAVEALLSNKPDKARHVSASCRNLIDDLLKELVPNVETSENESPIRKRIKILFSHSETTASLVDATVNLIQTLNKVQCKGDHSSIDESLSFFMFEITDKVVYFILTNKK